MKFNKLYILAMLVALPQALGAQEAWDLRKCIDHALENNLTVKSGEVSVQQSEVDLNTAKNSRLPDLAASAGQNFSFGRGLSESNTYVNTNTASTSFSLGSSIIVFSGFRTNRTIKMDALNLEAATADLEKARDDIRVQVTRAYVQILYDMEILQVAERQVSIDSVQVERLRAMLENGKASPSELAQQEAALGQSRLTATQARNTLNLAVLDLAQLLELPSPSGFSIVVPEIPDCQALPGAGPEDIYASAVAVRPAVKAEQFRLEAADMNIRIARSSLYPSLTLNGGIGSNFYKSNGYESADFWGQMKNNFSQYLGFNLSIPIFNHFSTRNKIRTAKIDRENQMLRLENTKKDLYKEIQQVYYNAVASLSKYASSLEAKKSNEDAFELTKAKYENGKATLTEFNEQKNDLLKAESDLVQAKYEYLYQTSLLDFYRGRELTF